MRAHDEMDLQAAVVSWWDEHAAAYGCVPADLYHCKNEQWWRGGKSAGIRPGVPDLSLDVPAGPYHGLRIELKTPRGRVSQAQSETHARLRSHGYAVAVVRSLASASAVIDAYMRGGEVPCGDH